MRVWIVLTYVGKREQSVGKLVNIKTFISSNSNSLTHLTLLILFAFLLYMSYSNFYLLD
jgi:hypothetical protein